MIADLSAARAMKQKSVPAQRRPRQCGRSPSDAIILAGVGHMPQRDSAAGLSQLTSFAPAQGGKPQWTVEDVKARQSNAVRAWLDKQVGTEKLELAKLLQEHAVIVRGGPEHAQRLMDALIVRYAVCTDPLTVPGLQMAEVLLLALRTA